MIVKRPLKLNPPYDVFNQRLIGCTAPGLNTYGQITDGELLDEYQLLYDEGVREIVCLDDLSRSFGTDLSLTERMHKANDRWRCIDKHNRFNPENVDDQALFLMTDFDGLVPSALDLLVSRMNDMIDKHTKTNTKIAIHCAYGIGRTGFLLAALLLSNNSTNDIDGIIKSLREGYHPSAVESASQYNLLQQYVARF